MQAARRCNRHGELTDKNGELIKGQVYVLNPAHESTDMLAEIQVVKHKRKEFFEMPNINILAPDAITRYSQYYF